MAFTYKFKQNFRWLAHVAVLGLTGRPGERGNRDWAIKLFDQYIASEKKRDRRLRRHGRYALVCLVLWGHDDDVYRSWALLKQVPGFLDCNERENDPIAYRDALLAHYEADSDIYEVETSYLRRPWAVSTSVSSGIGDGIGDLAFLAALKLHVQMMEG